MDTPASARVRIAYVKSLVSNIITHRIFRHFLFTHDHLDDTFNEWAEYLLRKSTKREAFWRQRTLHAAFSCPSSKAKINKFAGEVIEEIIAAIKPFADKSKRQQMMTAVKQIVKTAAETWRYARIELSRITATPATNMNDDQDGEQLLSIFPRIEREPLPNDFSPDGQGDEGCVYSPGQTLSKKSSAVLARRVELGGIITTSAAEQREGEVRPEYRGPRKMSSGIATRARVFEPRCISPLTPPLASTQGSRGKAATVSDEMSDIDSAEQYEHGTGWDANQRHSSTERYLESQKEEESEGGTVPSPLRSPARSRGQPPQLSQQSTTADSSSGDEASEGTEKPGTVPDWEGAGGSIPGAYGW